MDTPMWWTWYVLLLVGPLVVAGLVLKDWLTPRRDVVRTIQDRKGELR